MADCLFCKIRDGEIPAQLLHDDPSVIAIADINPQAPLHALVIPRKHIATLNDLDSDDEALVGHMARVAVEIARGAGHGDAGYRTVFNTHAAAGQTVFH